MLNTIINIYFSLIVSAGQKVSGLAVLVQGLPGYCLSVSAWAAAVWRLAWGWGSCFRGAPLLWRASWWWLSVEAVYSLPHHSTAWASFQHGSWLPQDKWFRREGGNGDVFCGSASEIAHCHCHGISWSQGSTTTDWEKGLHSTWGQESDVHWKEVYLVGKKQ